MKLKSQGYIVDAILNLFPEDHDFILPTLAGPILALR